MSAMRCDGSIVRRWVQVEENVCWALRRIWEPQKQGQLERTTRRDIEDEAVRGRNSAQAGVDNDRYQTLEGRAMTTCDKPRKI